MYKSSAQTIICSGCELGETRSGTAAGRAVTGSVLEMAHRHELVPADAPQWVAVSVAYMLAHINEPLRVSTLMEKAGLSASQFFTLFKRTTGCTPLEFFIAAKMSRARELLSSTRLTVKEIASVLGYDDQFYFSRRFKLVNGMSPKAFRAMINAGKCLDIASTGMQQNTWARLPSPIAMAQAPVRKWAIPRECVSG